MTKFGLGSILAALMLNSPAIQGPASAEASPLYEKQPGMETRWVSFENPTGEKGQGGKENRGAKGHAFDSIAPGEAKVLMDVAGAGIVRRMWFTLTDRDPYSLRALRLEMYWDSAATPAVAVPFGDFVGAILGHSTPFENALFCNPEGRSYNCYIEMPFRTHARIVLTNDAATPVEKLFYDIDYTLSNALPDTALYFHAYWHRERWTTLERDFEILPRVVGEGRFLGTNAGIVCHPDNVGWWGEGEVKMYLDGDGALPTIVGTGTEDYIGTGWGQGKYQCRYQGSLVADEKTKEFAFYRYHIPDPVYFHKDIRVTIQQMGGSGKKSIQTLIEKGVAVKPVSVDGESFVPLFDTDPPRSLKEAGGSDEAWVNVYRQDDWSAVAFFYLDAPENGLPKIQPLEVRTEAIPKRHSAQN